MIQVEVIADSINRFEHRLTTFRLKYPRFIHVEFMTHRMFSRNASSSRAISTTQMIKEVLETPAVPAEWRKLAKTMQGFDSFQSHEQMKLDRMWHQASMLMVEQANCLRAYGVHKQHVNRLLEPWLHINVICSATHFENFFRLRDHPDAEPTIQALARDMKTEYARSTPVFMAPGQWHLPFVTEIELAELGIVDARKLSGGRCARVSYNKESDSVEADLQLAERLLAHRPLHATPWEHQATPLMKNEMSKNFRGWAQYRTILVDEFYDEYNMK